MPEIVLDSPVAPVLSTLPAPKVDSEYGMITYASHNEAMRIAEHRFQDERDRRYTEVNVEKEKALKIKETADLAALSLARESQVYKDQQADVMREKNLAASGVYATNADLTTAVDKIEKALKPVFEFISSQQGIDRGSSNATGKMYMNVGMIVGAITIISFLLNHFIK
jgi:hypothetical protein